MGDQHRTELTIELTGQAAVEVARHETVYVEVTDHKGRVLGLTSVDVDGLTESPN